MAFAQHSLPQKIVGIAGRPFEMRVRVALGEGPPVIEWTKLPPGIHAPGMAVPRACYDVDRDVALGTDYAYQLIAATPGRGVIELLADGWPYQVPCAVFRPREFFVCMVLSSNFHYGWDPLSYLFGGTPENLQLEGHAWPKLRQLEKMYHMRDIPVTWLIDEKVAAEVGSQIMAWKLEFGDDFGILPSSLIHHNALNYNISKTADEVLALLGAAKAATEDLLGCHTNICGVDQWIGSIGSNFVDAAYRLGLKGLWGAGFDHRMCDTSMYHRGCPWDSYKPDKQNFRVPAGHASNLWIHQWTSRDVLLSFRTPEGDGPGGAVMFSTDPDHVRIANISQSQPGYWNAFFDGLRRNFSPLDSTAGTRRTSATPPPETDSLPPQLNDFSCFVIHQEDHDGHFPENADQIRTFLDALAPETVTFATLEEVSAWLNLSYAPEQHPSQVLYLEDHLTCHDAVNWYAGVKKPEDWPKDPGKYPPGIAYYDADMMWYASEGDALPRRFFNYRPRIEIAETESYPETDLRGVVTVEELSVSADGDGLVFSATVQSDREFAGAVPIIAWHAAPATDADGSLSPPQQLASDVIAIHDSLIFFVRLNEGAQDVVRRVTPLARQAAD